MGDSIIRRASGHGLKLIAYLDFVPGALTRLVAGFAFYDSGKGKIENMENTVNFFSGLGIPFPEANAAFVARLEYYGGMLLLLGVATRVVSLLLSSTMIVALLTAHRDDLIGALTRTGEAALSDLPPFVLGVLLSWLVVKGAGALSVDFFIRKAMTRERPAETPRA
jgi:putative oxidoreductase